MKTYGSILIIILISFNCKKSADKDINTNSVSVSGHLKLSRQWFTYFTATGKSDSLYESASAQFDDGSYNKDAGVILYGDSVLYKSDFTNLYYSYGPDQTVNTFSPGRNGGKIWTVSGNTQNKISSFSITAPQYSSGISKVFNSIPIVNKTQGFTVDWDNSVPCDSLLIGIYQNNTVVRSKVTGNISSYSFSPTELSVFDVSAPVSQAVIIIEGFSYKKTDVMGADVIAETYTRRNCTVKIIN